MLKFKRGSITNPENGITKDIVVKAASPNNLKDILIGGGLVLVGITYLTNAAFNNGVYKFEEAEITAMRDAGVIKD